MSLVILKDLFLHIYLYSFEIYLKYKFLWKQSEYVLHYFFLFFKAGGVAGMAVDGALFPLDTLKTRLQSPDGFRQSGGFRGVYSGLGPAILGSAPTG